MPDSTKDLALHPDTILPKHIAVIMDGNGRWAKQRDLPRTDGHKKGVQSAKAFVENALDFGISHVTLYTFSQENWKRPAKEIHFLFELLTSFITNELAILEKRGVQLRVLGLMETLPFPVRKALQLAIKRTSHNTHMVLNLAINYSGRQEIVDACNAFYKARTKAYADTQTQPQTHQQTGKQNTEKELLPQQELTPELLSDYLYTAGQPDPDLVIRTSGEQRLSNFLPFQTTYSELYFTNTLWPDFNKHDLLTAIIQFNNRNRRFGGLDSETEQPK